MRIAQPAALVVLACLFVACGGSRTSQTAANVPEIDPPYERAEVGEGPVLADEPLELELDVESERVLCEQATSAEDCLTCCGKLSRVSACHFGAGTADVCVCESGDAPLIEDFASRSSIEALQEELDEELGINREAGQLCSQGWNLQSDIVATSARGIGDERARELADVWTADAEACARRLPWNAPGTYRAEGTVELSTDAVAQVSFVTEEPVLDELLTCVTDSIHRIPAPAQDGTVDLDLAISVSVTMPESAEPTR